MRIVFVGPFGLEPKGTVSVRALPLAQALAAKGHTVTLLIPPWDDPARAGHTWDDGGVRVVNVALPQRWPLHFHLRLMWTLVEQTFAHAPEVVHLFKPKAYAGLTHWALWHLRRRGRFSGRLLLDTDDWEQAWNDISPYSPTQKKMFTWQENWGLRHADKITVASRALSELTQQEAHRSPRDIFYLPNGCRPAAADPPAPAEVETMRQQWRLGDAPTVLLYSRFVEFRLERIVALVKHVAAHVPDARWLIVGKGLHGEEQTLAARLAEAQVAKHVRFAGWVQSEKLPAYFQAADVAVHPYDDTVINRTKCSVKLIDLLAAGLPVVADAIGQNCEYIAAEKTGLLTPAEDDAAFGAAIVRLLTQPDLRRQLGEAAAQTIREKYRWSALAAVAEQAYHL